MHNYGIPRNTTIEILSTWETANRTQKKHILIELHIPGFYHYYFSGGGGPRKTGTRQSEVIEVEVSVALQLLQPRRDCWSGARDLHVVQLMLA